MSVVINVQSIDGEDREINSSNKCLKFFISHPQVLLWCFIIIILGISIGISEYAKQNKI
jgi:hypothetical protein